MSQQRHVPQGRGTCDPADERGQIIVLVALAVVLMLGMAGLAIDVGYAYYSQRSLQASVDAAALAGAMSLPSPSAAAAAAANYGGSQGAANARSNVPGVTTSVTTKCLASAPRCAPVNAIVVTETAKVSTIFSRVLGIDSFDVHARAVACAPCTQKALDIMLVLDRTGSMCADHNGYSDPACTDLNNARTGMKTFLGFLDPRLDRVGLAVFPPAANVNSTCSTPSSANYNSTGSMYVVVGLSDDYASGGALEPGSPLVSTINCQKGGGSTAYATAVEKAQEELDLHGRAGVRDVIVVLSDGAANTGPSYYAANSPYRTQPCHQGVTSAAASSAKGAIVYTVGYDLDAQGGDANVCLNANGSSESPAISAYTALRSMATETDNFYNKPDPGQLNTIFTRIAADISGPNARLISETTQ